MKMMTNLAIAARALAAKTISPNEAHFSEKACHGEPSFLLPLTIVCMARKAAAQELRARILTLCHEWHAQTHLRIRFLSYR
jgi:hypothetical protein